MRWLQPGPWVPGPDEVEQLVRVLADEGLQVVARHVVPLDPVVVEVVQDAQARLVVALHTLVTTGVITILHNLQDNRYENSF